MAIAPHHLLPEKPFSSYGDYVDQVGESAIAVARRIGAAAVMQELRRSGLRGRGGAGFPTAVKWSSIESHPSESRVVACNAAEGEPGTFKDRHLIRRNPYAVLEGMLIAAFVVGARDVYVATKASFLPEIERLKAAAQEIAAAGLFSYHEIHFVEGPEEYLFGEEKALLEVIEGNDPLPREPHYPPYERGLFATPQAANPALVNNAETYAHVPSIVRLGGASFAEIGTPDTTGTILYTVSGDVLRPGVYELPAGITLRKLFYDVAGGLRPGRSIKAVLSGVSAAVITPDKLDVPADFASLALAGSGLGSAGFIVVDSAASIPRITQSIARFLYVESCNQCSACKHGLGIASGAIDELFDPELATVDDYERALYGARSAPQGNRCYLPVQGSVVISSLMTRFRSEFQAQLAQPDGAPEPYLIPKIVDFDETSRAFRYDTDQPRKRPDWTYDTPVPSLPPKSVSPGKPKRVPPAIRLAPDVRDALARTLKDVAGDPERIVNEALREWLKSRGG
jgi:NADH-quinone oxidoreductase subunit F